MLRLNIFPQRKFCNRFWLQGLRSPFAQPSTFSTGLKPVPLKCFPNRCHSHDNPGKAGPTPRLPWIFFYNTLRDWGGVWERVGPLTQKPLAPSLNFSTSMAPAPGPGGAPGARIAPAGGPLLQFPFPGGSAQGLGPGRVPQGNDQAAAFLELFGQGRGHPGHRGGDQDGVKGGLLGPPQVAIPGLDPHPGVAQGLEAGRSLPGQIGRSSMV